MKIGYSCSCGRFHTQRFTAAEMHAEACSTGGRFEVQSKIPLRACPVTNTGLGYSAEGLVIHIVEYGCVDALCFRALKTLSEGLIRPHTVTASRAELRSEEAWKTLEWLDREDLRSRIESIDTMRGQKIGRQAGDPFFGTLVQEIRQLLASGIQRQLPMLDHDESKRAPGRSCVPRCDAVHNNATAVLDDTVDPPPAIAIVLVPEGF